MDVIQNLIDTARRRLLRVVLPEGEDARIVAAARRLKDEGIAAPIVLGTQEAVRAAVVDLDGIVVIDPRTDARLDAYGAACAAGREKMSPAMATRLVAKPLYFGGMMVKQGDADAMVAGAANPTRRVIEAGLMTVGLAEGIALPSSYFLMVVPDYLGHGPKALIFADCAVNADPSAVELADIAIASARSAKRLLGEEPRVALLSYSTKGSATHPSIGKVQAATALARQKAHQKNLQADFDGELQVDAALVPEIATRKLPDSKVAGRANVLIFPDLNSGNIASKLVQHVGRAHAYGQILLGLDRPAADVSRGSTTHDILGVAAIVGVQSIAYNQLYPKAGLRLPGEL